MRRPWLGLLLILGGCGRPDEASIIVHGDSTAIASRITFSQKLWNLAPTLDSARWFTILAHSYHPSRRVWNDGVKGQNISRLIAKLDKRPDPQNATVIVYDRLNDDEGAIFYMAGVRRIVAMLGTRHYLVMPQVPATPATKDQAIRPRFLQVNEMLLRELPAHTFSRKQRDTFLAELANPTTRYDGIHRNATGATIEARYIKRWLSAHGW